MGWDGQALKRLTRSGVAVACPWLALELPRTVSSRWARGGNCWCEAGRGHQACKRAFVQRVHEFKWWIHVFVSYDVQSVRGYIYSMYHCIGTSPILLRDKTPAR